MDALQIIFPENPHSPMTDTPISTVYPLKTLAGVVGPKVKSGVQAALTGKDRTGVATARIETNTNTNKTTRLNPLIEIPSNNPWFPDKNRMTISVTTLIVAELYVFSS